MFALNFRATRPSLADLYSKAFFLVAACLMSVILASGQASAASRVALVIGNAAYHNNAALKNPRNDAEAIALKLNNLGFRVLKGIDVDKFTLETLIRSFSNEIRSADVALFYYAGHGLRVGGQNYILPVDAKLKREADLDFEAVKLNLVLHQMERGKRTNIILMDACRNNPLASNLAETMGTRSAMVGRGLARVDVGIGTFIGFATQPDKVALDGDGENSPFTEALLKHIETPGLDIEVLMRRVRQHVISATNGEQVPWSRSSLIGDSVVLKAKPAVATPEVVKPLPAAIPAFPANPQADTPVPGNGSTADKALELAFWNSIRQSKNPALYRAYLEQFPDGTFASLARTMVAIHSVQPKAKELQPDRRIEPQAPLDAEPKVVNPTPLPGPGDVASRPVVEDHGNVGAIPLPRHRPEGLVVPQHELEPEVIEETPKVRKKHKKRKKVVKRQPVKKVIEKRRIKRKKLERKKRVKRKKVIKKRVVRKQRVQKRKVRRNRRNLPSNLGNRGHDKGCPQCLTK